MLSVKQIRSEDDNKAERQRVPEIDGLRVLAIFMMILYHFAYDLSVYGNRSIDYKHGPLACIGKVSGILFIVVSGISCGLSRNNRKRGVVVFGYGMLLTLITYLIAANDYIRFGILHFLGTAILIHSFLSRYSNVILILSAAGSFLLGIFSRIIITDNTFLLVFGIVPPCFTSMDYYPIFPYIAYFIVGMLIYRSHLFPRDRRMKIGSSFGWLEQISKNSLWIYLLHQPVLLGGIRLFDWISSHL